MKIQIEKKNDKNLIKNKMCKNIKRIKTTSVGIQCFNFSSNIFTDSENDYKIYANNAFYNPIINNKYKNLNSHRIKNNLIKLKLKKKLEKNFSPLKTNYNNINLNSDTKNYKKIPNNSYMDQYKKIYEIQFSNENNEIINNNSEINMTNKTDILKNNKNKKKEYISLKLLKNNNNINFFNNTTNSFYIKKRNII